MLPDKEDILKDIKGENRITPKKNSKNQKKELRGSLQSLVREREAQVLAIGS